MEQQRLLTKVRQNDIFEMIKHLGLEPCDFKWGTRKPEGTSNDYVASNIVHVPTMFYFTFGISGDRCWSEWWPPDDKMASYGGGASWDDQQKAAYRWLTLVKRECDAPDLWATVTAETALTSAGSADTPNNPFSPSEVQSIKKKLDEIAAYIKTTHPLGPEQSRLVGVRILYLKSAAERTGRIDWINIVVSQLVTMVVVGVVPSTAFGDLMRFVAATLEDVLQTATRLLH